MGGGEVPDERCDHEPLTWWEVCKEKKKSQMLLRRFLLVFLLMPAMAGCHAAGPVTKLERQGQARAVTICPVDISHPSGH